MKEWRINLEYNKVMEKQPLALGRKKSHLLPEEGMEELPPGQGRNGGASSSMRKEWRSNVQSTEGRKELRTLLQSEVGMEDQHPI